MPIALVAILLGAPVGARGEDWREVRTAHYTIKTDLPITLAEDLARRMDAMFGDYARRLSTFAPPDPSASYDVYLFTKKDGYTGFTDGRLPNSGGAFLPTRNILTAFLEGQGRDALRRTLQHEAFHQFAHTAISPNLPTWLDEGMAQYFEEGIWTGRGFHVGQVPPRRVRQLQTDVRLGRVIPFRQFMTMTPEQWKAGMFGDADLAQTQYHQAWAMVHFLVHGENNGESFRPRLIEMLELIHGGTPAEAAFTQAFSDNIEGFQDLFTRWAMTLRATPEATLIERQSVLAEVLIVLDGKGERFETMSQFRRTLVESGFRMYDIRNGVKLELEHDPSAYFADHEGRPMSEKQLSFVPRAGAPLPDIVCRFSPTYQIRTQFHQTGDTIEHEVLVEPVK